MPGFPVFPFEMLSKGERIDVSQAERDTLRSVLTRLADAYREGVRHHVQGR